MDHRYKYLFGSVRATVFDDIRIIDWADATDHYKDNWTLDVAAGIDLTDSVTLILGAANVLNSYPTTQAKATKTADTETGGLWDAVQMGFSGAFYYAKLGLRI